MNAHRVKWIGRDKVPGHWCRTCWTFAPTVRAMQIHADVYEPGVRLPTEGVLLDDEDERRVFDCPVCGSGGFGVSYDFLYQGVRSEELPSIRPSREYLVEPDEVEAFLQRKSAERAEASD